MPVIGRNAGVPGAHKSNPHLTASRDEFMAIMPELKLPKLGQPALRPIEITYSLKQT
jgi:hypothetical protein